MVSYDLSYFTDFEQIKNFADFEQVKKISSHFTDFMIIHFLLIT